jgi:hypothetical protein
VPREAGLYGGEPEATDSAKFRANNSRKNNRNLTTAEREPEKTDKKSNEYLAALERGDKEEAGREEPGGEAIKTAPEKLRKREVKFEGLRARVEAEGEVSTVDADARLMRSGGDARPLDVCCNVRTVADGKHHLIVDFDLAERSDDKGNLLAMSQRAKEVLDVEKITNLSDKGYYDGEDIAACEAEGITCLVAKPRSGGVKKTDEFTRERFVYDREKDCHICPCQNLMKYMRNQKHGDGKEYRVYANYGACGKRPKKRECTKAKHRRILGAPYQDTLDMADERTRENKALYRKRQEIVEHPFGTVKAVWGYKQFLCRGKTKAAAEVSLAYLAYNIRRVVNIMAEKVKQEANPAAA